MKNKIRIGLDVDGVLRDFHKQTIKVWNRDNPDKPFFSEHWLDHGSFYKMFDGNSSDERRKKAFDWWVNNGIYLDAPQLYGASEKTNKLQSLGFPIVIISHQTKHSHYLAALHTTTWLYLHRIGFDEIFYGRKKYEIAVDVLVEDNIDIAAEYLCYHPQSYVILLNSQYNQHVPEFSYDEEHMIRIFEDGCGCFWDQIYNLILNMNDKIKGETK